MRIERVAAGVKAPHESALDNFVSYYDLGKPAQTGAKTANYAWSPSEPARIDTERQCEVIEGLEV